MVRMSKACWQGFETDIKRRIGGTKQYAQSVKHFVRKEKLALGDVKNSKILAECKVRDYATKKFRRTWKAKVYHSFNIEYEWWDQLVKECADVNAHEGVQRIPILFMKPKFGREEHVLVMMWSKDEVDMMKKVSEPPYLGFPGTTYVTDKTDGVVLNKKSMTIRYGDTWFPFMTLYDRVNMEHVVIMKLKHFELTRDYWADPVEVEDDRP